LHPPTSNPPDREPRDDPSQIGGFRVVRRLASGGTSDVYLARSEGPHGFERMVALKVLSPRFRNDPGFERMFAREATAYARLFHPAIVKLYDFFVSEGRLVMVLEYVDGLPLNKLRALLRISGDKLDDRVSLFIASQVFSGLAAAHAATDMETGELLPVVHRDINPANVLLPWDGHAKITDFGIAKVTGIQGESRSEFIKGTYGYMAPEQVRGENVTTRADIYSATLVLWEMLARRKAIQRGALSEVEVLKAMAKPNFPSLSVVRPDLDANLREAVRRGLEPHPEHRSIMAEEMASLLRTMLEDDQARALLVSTLERVRPPPPGSSRAPEPSTTDTLVEVAPGGSLTFSSLADPSASGAPSTEEDPSPRPFSPPPPATLPHPFSEPHSHPAGVGIVRDVTPPELTRPATLRWGSSAPPPLPSEPAASSKRPPPPLPSESVASSKRPPAPRPREAGASGAYARTLVSPGTASGAGRREPLPLSAAPPSPPAPVVSPASRSGSAQPALPRFPLPSGVDAPVASFPPNPTIETARRPEPLQGPWPPPPEVVPTPGDVASALPIISNFPARQGTFASSPPPRSRSVGWPIVILLLAVLGGATVVYFGVLRRHVGRGSLATAHSVASTTTATTTTATTAKTPIATVTATATPIATATPNPTVTPTVTTTAAAATVSTPPPVSTLGDLVAPREAAGHRLFVDGHVVGQAPGTFHVLCGTHTVKVGSGGLARSVKVPCGGVVDLSP
jgi:serine/threonine protein kinase